MCSPPLHSDGTSPDDGGKRNYDILPPLTTHYSYLFLKRIRQNPFLRTDIQKFQFNEYLFLLGGGESFQRVSDWESSKIIYNLE